MNEQKYSDNDKPPPLIQYNEQNKQQVITPFSNLQQSNIKDQKQAQLQQSPYTYSSSINQSPKRQSQPRGSIIKQTAFDGKSPERKVARQSVRIDDQAQFFERQRSETMKSSGNQSNSIDSPILNKSKDSVSFKKQQQLLQNQQQQNLVKGNNSNSPVQRQEQIKLDQDKQQVEQIINGYLLRIGSKENLNEIENQPSDFLEMEIINLAREMKQTKERIMDCQQRQVNEQTKEIYKRLEQSELMNLENQKKISNFLRDKISLRRHVSYQNEVIENLTGSVANLYQQLSDEINRLKNYNNLLPSEREQQLEKENANLKIKNGKLEEQIQNSLIEFQELFKDAQEAKLVILNQLAEIKKKKQQLQTKEIEIHRKQNEFKKKYQYLENMENVFPQDDSNISFTTSNPPTTGRDNNNFIHNNSNQNSDLNTIKKKQYAQKILNQKFIESDDEIENELNQNPNLYQNQINPNLNPQTHNPNLHINLNQNLKQIQFQEQINQSSYQNLSSRNNLNFPEQESSSQRRNSRISNTSPYQKNQNNNNHLTPPNKNLQNNSNINYSKTPILKNQNPQSITSIYQKQNQQINEKFQNQQQKESQNLVQSVSNIKDMISTIKFQHQNITQTYFNN